MADRPAAAVRPRPYRPDRVPVAFLDYGTGRGVLASGAPLSTHYRTQRGRLSLPAIVETARAEGVRRVLLVGKRPPAGWLDEELEGGWTTDPAGHYVDTDDPCGRFVGPAGERVEVRRVAAWLGDEPVGPGPAREAMALFVSALRQVGRERVGLMASPAATGQSLWAASLPADWEGERLDEEAAVIFRRSSTQHRMEVLGSCHGDCDAHLPAPAGQLPELHYYDGRLMYLGCTRERAVGPARRLTAMEAEDELDNPGFRGRVFVEFVVPADWDGPGVLMVPHEDGAHWHAPNRPGFRGWCWADSVEVWQARKAGWTVKCDGALKLCGRTSLLDTWTRQVLRMREVIERAEADEATRGRALAAVRMMALATIGAFHSTGRDRTIVADGPSAIPDGVRTWATRPDGSVVYRVPAQLTGNAAAFARPELSSQVWAMARWKVLAAMLTMPRESLVAVWGDAVYLDRAPAWPDDGKVGRLRSKGYLAGPVRRPKNLTQLVKLRDRMVK